MNSVSDAIQQKHIRSQILAKELTQYHQVRANAEVDPRVLNVSDAQNAGSHAQALEAQLAQESAAAWGGSAPIEVIDRESFALSFADVHRGRKSAYGIEYTTNYQYRRKTLEEALIGDLTKPMDVRQALG
ncbi:unnamed protein product [Amoebophrya sp. A25]|nr:unnamed protein product [Amoebophrya sp. A25]|eukprot:GSA25T00005422001.1